jgi:hypothetical protein
MVHPGQRLLTCNCLFIDLLLFYVQRAVFQLYSQRKQVQQYVGSRYNRGSDGSTETTAFDCHWKNMKSWAGTVKVSLL